MAAVTSTRPQNRVDRQSHRDAQTRIGAADPSPSRCKSLSRSEERSRPIQLEAVRHHDDRLRRPLAFVHRKVDRLSLVGEQPAPPALCVSDDPAPKMVLPDVEARTDRGRRFDALLLNHWLIPRLGAEAGCPRCWVRPVVAVVIDLWSLVEGPRQWGMLAKNCTASPKPSVISSST